MTVKRKRSCLQATPSSDNGPEVDSPEKSSQMEMDQGEKPAGFFLGFSCYILSLAIACSMVSSPNQPPPEGKPIVQKGLAPATKDSALRVAILPIQEVAACSWCTVCGHLRSGNRQRRAGPCRHTLAGCHGIGVQTRSTGPALDTRTVSARQNQKTWSGTSTWLETIAQVCPNLRFRFSLLYRLSRGSFCKSSSRSLSVSASMVLPRKSPHRVRLALSLPTADSGAPGNESSQRRATHRSLSTLTIHFGSLQYGSFARPQRFGSGLSNSSPPMSAPAKPRGVDAQERSRRARSLLVQAALWAPSVVDGTSSTNPLQSFPIPAMQRHSLPWQQLPNTSCRQRSPSSGALQTGLPPPPP